MSGWTPEDDALLHRLYIKEGMSAGLCARQFPGRSRCAVIGRAHRLGLKRPLASAPTSKAAYPNRAPAIERKTGRDQSPGSAEARAIGQRKTAVQGKYPTELGPTNVLSPNAAPWTQRQARQCAFPVDGEGADTISCCNPTERTYCAGHERVMFNGLGSYISSPERKSKKGRQDRTFEAWLAA